MFIEVQSSTNERIHQQSYHWPTLNLMEPSTNSPIATRTRSNKYATEHSPSRVTLSTAPQ